MKRTIVDEILELNFPEIHEVIVVGGAYMELIGLRKADDIDLAVSKRNWEHLLALPGWHFVQKGTGHCLTDQNDRFDVWQGWYDWNSKKPILFNDMLNRTVMRNEGFRVPTIDYQIRLKESEGRRKDTSDIRLLKTLVKP